MRRLAFRFIIALLTFTIGVAAAIIWFVYHIPSVEPLEYSPADVVEILNVPYCDLARDPNGYDQKIVRTQAILSRGLEQSDLYDPTCGLDDVSAWVRFDASYKVDSEMSRRLNEILCQSHPCPTGNASVTVVGRFHAPDGKGYGHLNGYRFLFEIMRVERVEKVTANLR